MLQTCFYDARASSRLQIKLKIFHIFRSNFVTGIRKVRLLLKMNKVDDIYYIEAVRKGDVTAFSFLVERYQSMVYSLALKLLKNAEETTSIQKVTGIIDPNNIASKKILLNNNFVSCKIYEIDDGSLAEMLSKKIM